MEDFTNVIKDNFEELKNSIEKVKNNYPNIDSDPNSHDGSYELIQTIIRQYKEEIDNSSNWGADDVNALYYATTFVKSDTKIKKISKSNLKNKEKIKQVVQNINKKFLNKEYTNNVDEADDIGMFKNVSGGFGPKTTAKATENDLKNFLIYCTEILDENNNDIIYDKFEKNLCNKVSDSTMSIGILSQILHCLKPNVFPVLNSGGLDFYKKALNIKMKSEKGKEEQINGTLKSYIKVINAIKDNTKDLKFNNYRILDIIAQKYYFDFSDKNIIKYLTNYAGKLTKEVPMNDDCGKDAYKDFQLLKDKLILFLKERCEKINSEFDYKLPPHNWTLGTKYREHFWAEFRKEEYKNLPYSISLFAEAEDDNVMHLRINIEYKGNPDEESSQIYNHWLPNDIDNFYKQWSKNSKLVKIINGPFEYATSRNIMEQIVDAFIKLEPEYNKLCNIASGNIIPAIVPAEKISEDKTMQKFPLNQILYGPPGTGKTYNTVVKAMEIIDGKKYTDNNGNLLETVEYDDLKQSFYKAIEGHRIEFITFHQSYSYEEFVEGIKPYIPKSVWQMSKSDIDKQLEIQNIEESKDQSEEQKITLPNIKYIGQKGIFKDICNRANKSELIEPSFDMIKEYFNNHYIEYNYKTPEGNPFKITELKEKAITIIPEDGETKFDLQYEHIEQLKNMDKDAISQEDLKAYCENENTTLNSYTSWYGSYYPAIVNTFKEIEKNLRQNPFYILIIDEINRGNISKIFGELITLIEEDKRKKVYEDGKEYNTLEVTLPYSQDTFSVPNNLYIIGTMNTADRSIASVDIALRRRFRFIEMMPQPELLKINDRELINVVNDGKKQYEINLKKLLETLNDRISYILDDDHQIGHSYFLRLLQNKDEAISEDELKNVFKYEILPLLNEYFYGDWEKIKAVLVKNAESDESLVEDSFIEEKKVQVLSCYCGDKKQCRFKKDFNIKEAIKCIADDIIQ